MSAQSTSKKKGTFYVTTAIAYPNARPHLGHALEIIQADVVARFHRLKGEEVFFQTGTDEHGLKNWQTAQQQGVKIDEFLDKNVASFVDLYKRLNISYDQFIRTTDKQLHHPGAKRLWEALVKAGDLYKQKYQGLYCTGCESFKLPRELEEGRCPTHPTREIETVEEENYFFRLSKYKDEVAKRIAADEYKVIPEQRKNEILSFLQEANDISFSRPKKTLPWGIPVPGDDEHVMYVWCDALSNYITGAGYGRDEAAFAERWPADSHIIGKDILRFHAAFWPAMLLSAKLPLPKELFVHGFILSKGVKMSKSTGNVIEPFDQIERYGADQFRFYVLESMPIDTDGDYAEELLVERVNAELVSNLANFIYRTLSFAKKNYDGQLGEKASDARAKELENEVAAKVKGILENYERYEFRKVVQDILHIADMGNAYFQEAAPWKNKEDSLPVLTTCANLVKELSILLSPIIPQFCERVQAQLGLKELSFKDLGFTLENHALGEPEIIWRQLEAPTPAEPQKEEKLPLDPSILDLIVAKIVKVDLHPKAEKLYVETLDDGSGNERVIVSGLVPYYSAEELLGKHIILVNNLKPAQLRGVLSQGMLLAAQEGDAVEVLEAPDAAPGTQVLIETFKRGEKEITIDDFFKLKIRAKDGRILCEGAPLLIDGKLITTARVVDGKVA